MAQRVVVESHGAQIRAHEAHADVAPVLNEHVGVQQIRDLMTPEDVVIRNDLYRQTNWDSSDGLASGAQTEAFEPRQHLVAEKRKFGVVIDE